MVSLRVVMTIANCLPSLRKWPNNEELFNSSFELRKIEKNNEDEMKKWMIMII